MRSLVRTPSFGFSVPLKTTGKKGRSRSAGRLLPIASVYGGRRALPQGEWPLTSDRGKLDLLMAAG